MVAVLIFLLWIDGFNGRSGCSFCHSVCSVVLVRETAFFTSGSFNVCIQVGLILYGFLWSGRYFSYSHGVCFLGGSLLTFLLSCVWAVVMWLFMDRFVEQGLFCFCPGACIVPSLPISKVRYILFESLGGWFRMLLLFP